MRTDYIGKGPMEGFVEDSCSLFGALQNPSTIVPDGFTGIPPSIVFRAGEGNATLTLFINDAIFLDSNYIDTTDVTDSGGSGDPIINVYAEGGKLFIEINHGV